MKFITNNSCYQRLGVIQIYQCWFRCQLIQTFNSVDMPGIPPHHLQLKVGSLVILLRNLNPPQLCNGTRLTSTKLKKNINEATIVNDKFRGENVLLPRIPMILTDVPGWQKSSAKPCLKVPSSNRYHRIPTKAGTSW